MEIDDELIFEADVYVNNSFLNELKILQFPLRPYTNNYTDQGAITAIAASADCTSFNIEITNRENPALQKTKNKEVTEPISFKGEKIDCNTNYCIGVMKQDKLILCPIQDFVQIRPFPYDAKNAITPSDKQVNGPLKRQAGSFGKKGSDPIPVLKQQLDKKLSIFNPDTLESQIQLERMSLLDLDNSSISNVNPLSSQEYFNLVFTNITQSTVAEELYRESTKIISFSELDEMSFNSKIMYLFTRAPTLTLDSVVRICISRAGDEKGLEDALKHLAQAINCYCRLVSGSVLVYKSELTLKNSEQKMRNTIIAWLAQGISKKDLLRYCEDWADSVGEYLNELGEYFKGKWYIKGYKLSLNEVISQYTERIKIMLAAKIIEDNDFFRTFKEIREGSQKSKHDLQDSNSFISQMENRIYIQLSKLFEEGYYFDSKGAFEIIQKKIGLPSANLGISADEVMKIYQKVIDNICFEINGYIYVKKLKNSSDNFNEVRCKVLGAFKAKTSISKSDLNKFVTSDIDIKELMKSINASSKGNNWMLKQ